MSTTDARSDAPFHTRGNYLPVADETTAIDLEVTGTIPEAISGLYVRNGPNPKHRETAHWFFGDGMLHGTRIEDGKAAWYRNRWIQTRALNEPDAQMRDDEGGTDHTIGVNNTHVIRHAGRILTLVESSYPCEVSPELDTVGVHDFGGRLDTAMTAHPKICPVTGEMHFFGYSFFEPWLTYHRVDASGELIQSEVIDVAGPTMIHDFSITEGHVLFMDLPVVFDFDRALGGKMPYVWSDDYAPRVGVMPRGIDGAAVQWFDVDPCYVFHPLNSFEVTGADGATEIVCDTARYPELWRQDSGDFHVDANLHRWRLNLATGATAEEQLDDRVMEFPRVDERLVGLQNRYGYAVSNFVREESSSSIVRYDLETGASVAHDFGSERVAGEPVMVPTAADAPEGDGWLLSYVYDKTSDTSDLVILDASAPEAEPVATVHLPVRVPFGFHGSWLGD